MAWRQLDINDLRLILSEDEVQRLDTLSLDSAIQTEIQSTLDLVSDTWRGALIAQGVAYDIRDHYIPPEYAYWVLVHTRYAVWTRFPGSPTIALDTARQEEYKKAMELLAKPTIGASKPDPEYSSDNPAILSTQLPEIVLPYLRFNDELIWWNAVSAL